MLLHDHLDGGLRPSSVVELAREHGYGDLPSTDPDDLGKILAAGAKDARAARKISGYEWPAAG